MKLSQELCDAMCEQIAKEHQNMLTYNQIQSIFEDYQLTNIAGYFSKQAQDEKSHADKFIDYINKRTGGKVSIQPVDAPLVPIFTLNEIGMIGEIYVSVEEATTESIESLYELALESKSYMDLGFLEEMLNEQVAEEDESNEFSLNIKMVKDLVLFDKSFG
jgi:ferritin